MESCFFLTYFLIGDPNCYDPNCTDKIINWQDFEKKFAELMVKRKVEEVLDKALFDGPTALLCSEPEPDKCHRGLVAQYLGEKWGNIDIVHL